MGSASEIALIQAVQNNTLFRKNAEVDAVEILAQTKGYAAREALKVWITNIDPEIRQASRKALRIVAPNEFDAVDEAILNLDDRDQRRSQQALAVLAAAKVDHRQPLVSAKLFKLVYGQSESSGRQSDPLMKALIVWADAPAIKGLIKYMKNKFMVQQRQFALKVLAARKEPAAVRPMLDMTVDHWDMVRDPLISMGQVIEKDLLVLLRHKKKNVKLKGCVLAAAVGTAKSMRMVMRLMRDKNKDVRTMAKWSAEMIRKRTSGQPMGRLIPPVRIGSKFGRQSGGRSGGGSGGRSRTVPRQFRR